jgi:hypothetical protein
MRTVILGAALVAVLVSWSAGCGGPSGQPDTGTIPQSFQVSECGGFAQAGGILLGDPLGYCDAEVLHWQYDPDLSRLSLTDARAALN